MPPTSVFISYSSRDRKEAFEIKRLLEANAVKVWLDFFDIRPAAELRGQLAEKVRDAQVFCLLLSPYAVQSAWVRQEIDTALAAARDGLRILPVILRPCQIPKALEGITGFDASDGLEHEAVRLRLIRAVGGNDLVEDRVLLDEANRLLLANKEILLRAEAELPDVGAKIAAVASQPLRKVSLVIYPETLPEDPDIVLEIRLSLDTLFHGEMSFLIAQYREGRTWPQGFEFDEPPYTDYYLTERPRLDVVFKWFDRVVRLTPQGDGTDLRLLPATFPMEFDGERFKPQGDLTLAQVFEIPSLATLEKDRSHFRLIAHDPKGPSATEVGAETDIDLELNAEAGEQSLCLFQSRLSGEQRIVQGSQYLATIASPIRRAVILERYLGRPAVVDRRPEIAAALEKGEFESDEQRRLGARFRFSQARLARFRTQHRDAYKMFQQVAELLQPLVMDAPPLRGDAELMFMACHALVDIWLRQESYPQAAQLAGTLGMVAERIYDADTKDADYRRMWAEALLVNAHVHAKVGDIERAAGELDEHVEMFEKLHAEVASPERRTAYLKVLADAIRRAAEWPAEAGAAVEQWKSALAAEIGEGAAEQVTKVADDVPEWLQPSDPKGWPTKAQESSTLRYALKIPEWWNAEPQVRGTSREVEHVYRGKRITEWLVVGFMDKANAESNMKNWVETHIGMSGFPVILDKTPPELRQWNYLGRLPGVAKKLNVDEAHGYVGTAGIKDEQRALLGRLYVVLARRKTFAWKFVLCIETACLEGTPEERVAKQDHVRAGAILGALSLDGL